MIRRKKYNTNRCKYDWYNFDSKLEMEFYKWALEQEYIRGIYLQPRFILQDKFIDRKWKKHQSIEYRWDFKLEYYDWDIQVIDIKWFPDAQAKIKRKMFLKLYPDLKLKRLVRYKWERVDYDENEKRKKSNK